MTASIGTRRAPLEEEDATTLRLGTEFQHAHCLTNSEVCLLLQAQKDKHLESSDSSTPLHAVFQKTLTYVLEFSRYKNKETVRDLRASLYDKDLEQFEIAQLANLCPTTAEEARTLIPSLQERKEDEELQRILDDMATARRYQG